jgi:hypothetical protein
VRIVRPVAIGDAQLASSTISEDDHLEWAIGTTYADGERVIIAADHDIYESLQSANIGRDPTDAAQAAWWTRVGSTNKWRMFDDSPSQQSAIGSVLAVSLVPGERIDTVALMNISAASVTITQTDAVDGLVYDETYPLISDSGIQDWYAYFFEPIVRLSDFTVGDLYPYISSVIGITLDDPGSTVLCGECVIGLSRELGDTQYGAKVGIADYSIKQADDWGNYTVVARSFAKTAEFVLWIEPGLVSEVHGLLASYRATPIVYFGADAYTATMVYGFFKDFSIEIAYPSFSVCSLTVEGLT